MSDILPDECDFCGQVLDEDESLTPVFIGERPEPTPVTAKATARKQREVIGRRDNSPTGVQVLGRPVGELTAILSALGSSDRFDIDAKPAVAEVYAVGDTEPSAILDAPAERFDAKTDDSKVGVTITAHPEQKEQSPDLEVCEFCVDRFERDGE